VGRLTAGQRDRAGHPSVRLRIQLLQERYRLQVFPAAVLVRKPVAVAARVVQIEHRRHRIDAKTVDVKLLEPIERIAHQERAHFVAPVIEDERPPVPVFAPARVGMLVQRGAVELGEAVLILGKVARHPVEEHADAVPVALIDEIAEVVG
jgi:hypothetical protein